MPHSVRTQTHSFSPFAYISIRPFPHTAHRTRTPLQASRVRPVYPPRQDGCCTFEVFHRPPPCPVPVSVPHGDEQTPTTHTHTLSPTPLTYEMASALPPPTDTYLHPRSPLFPLPAIRLLHDALRNIASTIAYTGAPAPHCKTPPPPKYTHPKCRNTTAVKSTSWV